MSVTYVEQRVCDVCGVAFEPLIASWMTMTAPNLEEPTEFDFCTWACLQSWVVSEVDEDTPDTDLATELATPEAQEKLDKAMSELEERVAAMPPMSLAEAIASGKMDFTRGPE
jgi:hypothetical protein